MRNAAYLTLSRHHLYYFRYPIPDCLHPEGKASKFKLSLNTRCPREALQLSRTLANFAAGLIRHAMLVGMDYKEIREAFTRFYKERLVQDSANFDRIGPMPKSQLQAYASSAEFFQQALDEDDYSFVGTDTQVIEAGKQVGLTVSPADSEFEMFRSEYLRAALAYFAKVIKLQDSIPEYNFSDMPAAMPVKTGLGPKQVKLTNEIAAYIEEAVRLNNGLKSKGLEEKERHLGMLAEIVGEDASVGITSEMASDVKNILLSLPRHISYKPELAGLSLREIAKLESTHPTKIGNMLGLGTVKKMLTTYSTFFNWVKKRKRIDENVFADLNISLDIEDHRREAFTSEQIGRILNQVEAETPA